MRRMILSGGIVFALLFGLVGIATADTANYLGAGTPRATSGTVNVNAQSNPKITLTITTPEAGQLVDFGAQDPMSGTTKLVTVDVESNKAYDFAKTPGGDVALMGLTMSEANAAAEPKGSNTYLDTYTLNIPWDTDPGVALVATVQYTVTQN